MKATALLAAFSRAGKRTHLVGNIQAGVIIALDMEGRLFTVKDGIVLNRVNPAAIAGQGVLEEYLNPGGDVLWPAPEGTSAGYQYATGTWRVPPGLRSARYIVDKADKNGTVIKSEVDLINNKGIGIPTIFKRQIRTEITRKNSLTVYVTDSITYIGSIALKKKDYLLAPWSLCQFDAGDGCETVFPYSTRSSIWDLYDESSSGRRRWTKSFCHIATDDSLRYQVALDEHVSWIKFCDHRRGLYVRRSTAALPEDQSYIDIRDAAPEVLPDEKGVRYSIYNDSAGFMEIESAGGNPETMLPGTEISMHTTTCFQVK